MTKNPQYKTRLLRAVCITAAAIAVLLLACSLIFAGRSADIFGTNIWLVQTGSFSAIHKGSAVVSKRVPPQEIFENNVVVYRAADRNNLGLVKSVTPDGDVYRFDLITERGGAVSAEYENIVGKAEMSSLPLGWLISFVTAPVGMLIIIFIPCGLVVLMEYINATRPRSEVSVPKKTRPAYGADSYPPEPAATYHNNRYRDTAESAVSRRDNRYRDTAETEPSARPHTSAATAAYHTDENDLNRTAALPAYDLDRNEYRDTSAKNASVADRYSTIAAATKIPEQRKAHQPLSQSRLNRVMAETAKGKEPTGPLNTLKLSKLEEIAEEMRGRHTAPEDMHGKYITHEDTHAEHIPAHAASYTERHEIDEISRNAALEIQREKQALDITHKVARDISQSTTRNGGNIPGMPNIAKEITQAFAKIPSDETEQRLAKLARANDRPLAFPEALPPRNVPTPPTPSTRAISGGKRAVRNADAPVLTIPPLNTSLSRNAAPRVNLGQTATLPNFKDMLRDEPD